MRIPSRVAAQQPTGSVGVGCPFLTQILVALRGVARAAVMLAMSSTKSREVNWGGRISAAKINAESARQRAKEAARESDRAEAYAWSLRMEGYGGPAQPEVETTLD